MKNPTTNDPFHTESWSQECAPNPYRVFTLCFENAGTIDQLRKMMLRLPLFMDQSRPVTKVCSYRISCAVMAISSVIDAAHQLYKEKESIPMDKLPEYSYFFYTQTAPEYRSFATYLITESEYSNMRNVFRKFFNYKSREDWQSELQGLLYYSLTDHSVEVEINSFAIWFYLTKLLEAAYILGRC
ncbi:hypothetical protein [Niabella beijingensis]|uniref:hypothetical protein n=1 Tax=Niabella beijingensis TaxID=2872700 RepID=UPI001CBC9FAF|nr:hypothetical protein [Niabella beijingensis]MBZ4190639.1 hypothetical protein [Niabella beijingensis]